jgi:hypothetical protein
MDGGKKTHVQQWSSVAALKLPSALTSAERTPSAVFFKEWGAFRDTPFEYYFKLYKSQLPVVEQALETAALMLGTDKSRGYCMEMICADFLAGATLGEPNPAIFSVSIRRLIEFLPGPERLELIRNLKESA